MFSPNHTEHLDAPASSVDELVSQEQRIHLAFSRGSSVTDVAAMFGVSRAMAQNRFERFRKNTGDDSTHHPEKVELIHAVLSGKQGLRIYEVCGFKQSGEPGYCTAAYEKYGKVTSLSRSDGDWVQCTRRSVLELLDTKKRYDVVDLDGYADGAHVIEAGLLSLFSPRGGYFFVTWPSEKAAERWPVVRHRNLFYYGAEQPTLEQRTVYVARKAYMSGFVATRVAVRRHDSIIRAAFEFRRLHWDHENHEKQLAEARALFGKA